MKRKTYNNVMKAIKMIQKKGYDFEEASKMAIRLFDEHEKFNIKCEGKRKPPDALFFYLKTAEKGQKRPFYKVCIYRCRLTSFKFGF